jgi:hypothetical protein
MQWKKIKNEQIGRLQLQMLHEYGKDMEEAACPPWLARVTGYLES